MSMLNTPLYSVNLIYSYASHSLLDGSMDRKWHLWRGWRKKVTEEMEEQMKKMRQEGKSYKEIAKTFGLALSTVIYHLVPRQRELSILRAKKWMKEHPKKYSEELRKYYYERYHQDPEFRERFKAILRKYARKRYQLKKQLSEQYPEYKQALKLARKDRATYRKLVLDLRRKYNINFPL